MDITFLGHSSFRIKGKSTSVVTDPYDAAMVGFKFPKVSSEIVTISHNHADHNKSEAVSDVRKVVEGPGEYEISGVSIIGISSYHDSSKGTQRGKNTIYVIEIDGFRICHLGDLGHDLTDEMLHAIGDIHILMIPVGGEYTVGPEEAVKIAQSLDANVILPMHYQMEGLSQESFASLAKVDEFVEGLGVKSETLPKLTLKSPIELAQEQVVNILERLK